MNHRTLSWVVWLMVEACAVQQGNGDIASYVANLNPGPDIRGLFVFSFIAIRLILEDRPAPTDEGLSNDLVNFTLVSNRDFKRRSQHRLLRAGGTEKSEN